MPSDDRIEKLFSLPREEFTSARNALAADLSKAGDREGADTVKRFRKPTVSTWAVNQLAQREQQRVRALLSAGAQLRKAQTGLLKGGDAQKLREALAAEAEAVDELVEAAAATLVEAGHGASEAILRRVATTLRAAAVDEEAGAALSKGVLTEDLEPRGMEPSCRASPAAGPRGRDRRIAGANRSASGNGSRNSVGSSTRAGESSKRRRKQPRRAAARRRPSRKRSRKPAARSSRPRHV